MNPTAIAQDLQEYRTLCQELLALVEREGSTLRNQAASATTTETTQLKRTLLPRLTQSLDRLKKHRAAWQQLPLEERSRHPEIPPLIRHVQDLVLRIITLDRDNEQLLLRRGLIPPRHLPSVNQQRPHFVAQLYRQHGG